MTNPTPHGQVPEALRLAALLDAEKWTGSMTLVSYARSCVAELRRLHAENEALRTQQPAPAGAESKPHGWLYDWTHSSATGKPDTTYTGFTKDEAHARKHDNCTAVFTTPQPAPAPQQPCPTCAALARTVMLDQVSFDRKPDCYGIRQITDDEGVEEWEDIRTSPDVAREEANDMMATGRGEIYEVVPLWTTPQPAPATQQAWWTNADSDAARLALELECLLMDTKDTAVVSKWWQSANEALELHRARLQEAQPSPTPPAVVEPPELSPDFTDAARAALLWVLWHHQGGSSPVGQPIRFALGMGQHDRLNEHQLAEAKRWERLHPANPAVFPRGPEPLTDGLLQQHNRDSQELRRLCAARDQARSERDALKAEIAGLESSCSTLGRLVDELRPDAERLEWVLRRVSGTWLRAYLGVVSDTSDMDTLRTLIDANRGALTAHGVGIKKENGNG